MSKEAMQQALKAIEDSGCKADLMAAADALRAALAEQAQPVAWVVERAAVAATARRCIEMAMWPQGIDDEQAYYGRMFAEFIEREFKDALAAAPEAPTPPAPQPLTELPPLPESEYWLAFYDEGGMQEASGKGYAADQMRDYARAAVAEVLKRMGVQR